MFGRSGVSQSFWRFGGENFVPSRHIVDILYRRGTTPKLFTGKKFSDDSCFVNGVGGKWEALEQVAPW